MNFEDRLFVALFAALFGFALSQSVNLIKFLRRPRLSATTSESGVIMCYGGNPPDEPAEILLGITVFNNGLNAARNIRVFVSELATATSAHRAFNPAYVEFFEIRRPIDLLPASEGIAVPIGILKSNQQGLQLYFQDTDLGEMQHTIGPDTEYMQQATMKIHIHCDDSNSSDTFRIRMDLLKDDYAKSILEEFMQPRTLSRDIECE